MVRILGEVPARKEHDTLGGGPDSGGPAHLGGASLGPAPNAAFRVLGSDLSAAVASTLPITPPIHLLVHLIRTHRRLDLYCLIPVICMTGERHWFLENEFYTFHIPARLHGGLPSNQLCGHLSIQNGHLTTGIKVWRDGTEQNGRF